jgi:hypothetical protein
MVLDSAIMLYFFKAPEQKTFILRDFNERAKNATIVPNNLLRSFVKTLSDRR